MFKRIAIQDFGAPGELTLTFDKPMGWSDVSGPSGVGKTSATVYALTFALLGMGRDGKAATSAYIANGADRAEVEVETANGTTIRRSRTRGGTVKRTIVKATGEQTYPTEEAFAAAIGKTLKNAALVHTILTPYAWRTLLSNDLGRPMRNMLMSLLPPGDIRAEVKAAMEAAGKALLPSDPTDEPTALALQKSANAARDRADGVLAGMQSVQAAPSPEVVAESRKVLRADDEWKNYRICFSTSDAMNRAHDEAAALLADYTARKTALGPCPSAPSQLDVTAVTTSVSNGKTLVSDLVSALARDKAKLEQLREDLAHVDGGTCPTCGQGVPATPKRKIDAEAAIDAVVARIAENEAKHGKYAKALEEKEAKLVQLREEGASARTWSTSCAALGSEPRVPSKGREVVKPTIDEPTEDEVVAARDVLSADKNAATMSSAVESAEKDAAAKKAEAERCAALVVACRQAPTAMARKQSEAIGATGRLVFRFPPKENKQSAEMEVLYEDRSVDVLSDGEMVIADLWMRAVLRRLGGLTSLPIVADRAQDWTGDWPEIPGPVWRLWSTEGDLTVVAV